MNPSVLRELQARLDCPVRTGVPFAHLTTYRIGGPAAALVAPGSGADVGNAIRLAEETETRWLAIGLGSNLLVSDAGFDGVVIRLGRAMSAADVGGPEGSEWTVGAGLPTPLLAKRTARAGLAGVHRLIGVPGTVGGGVYMNAGAHAQEFRDVVAAVELVDETGEQRCVRGDQIPWRYRCSGLQRAVVLSARLALTPEDPALLRREIQGHLRWRKAGTPFEQPCCGSVFRNPSENDVAGTRAVLPEPVTAGRLVDAVGMKGFRVGGAEVSSRHANYIVNTGGATAADVRAVIEAVRDRVRRETGLELQLEVRVIE